MIGMCNLLNKRNKKCEIILSSTFSHINLLGEIIQIIEENFMIARPKRGIVEIAPGSLGH